jgi:hypothetical protein
MNAAGATNTVSDSGTIEVAAPAAYLLTAVLATDAQKAAFEVKLAEMDEHLGKIDLAVSDLQVALARTTDAAQKKVLSGRVASHQTASARNAENATRRPAITDELQQSVVVRPRLTIAAPGQTSARSAP